MKTKSKLLNRTFEIGVLTIGRALQMVAKIISIRVSTTLLSPGQLGSVSQMMSMAGGFGQILFSPVWIYIMRGFRDWHESGVLLKNLMIYLKYIIIVSFFSMICAGLLQWIFHAVNGISIMWVVVLVGIYLLFFPINSAGTNGLNLLYRRVEFVVFSNLANWVGLGLAAILVIVFSHQVYWVLGQYLGIAIAATSFIFLVMHLRSFKGKRVVECDSKKIIPFNIRAVFPFAWPQLVTSIMWWIQSQSYRFVLDKIGVIADVGLFSVSYGLAATPIILFESLFGQFYEPIYYDNLKGKDINGQAEAWNDYASAYVPAVLLVGTFVASSGPFLAKVFLGPRFQTVTNFFIWPAITEILRSIGATTHFLGIAKMDMRVLLLPVAVGAILAPTGVTLLGQWDALHGTGLALCIAMAASTVIGIYIGLRALPVTWPIRRILLSGLLAVPMIMGFQISKWVMPHPTIWLALIVLAIGGLYLLMAEYFLARKWIKTCQ
jgi:O-antigen/teichoic acid export membrane protein